MTDCAEDPWISEAAVSTPTFAELLAEESLFFDFDAANILGIADGAPITTWPDDGPNSFDATPGGVEFLYRNAANGINGLPAVQKLAGAPDELFLPAAADNIGLPNQGLTIFVVRESPNIGLAPLPLVSKYDGPGERHWRLCIGQMEAQKTINFAVPSADEIARVATGSDDTDQRIDLGIWWPERLTAIFKNGVLLDTAGIPTHSCPTGIEDIHLLSDGNATNPTLRCGQLTAWNRPFSTAELNVVYAALSSKWSISVSTIS